MLQYEGPDDGTAEGPEDKAAIKPEDAAAVGPEDGAAEGPDDGAAVGHYNGVVEGFKDGAVVGPKKDGEALGLNEGVAVVGLELKGSSEGSSPSRSKQILSPVVLYWICRPT